MGSPMTVDRKRCLPALKVHDLRAALFGGAQAATSVLGLVLELPVTSVVGMRGKSRKSGKCRVRTGLRDGSVASG
jgi:hypothetical protein